MITFLKLTFLVSALLSYSTGVIFQKELSINSAILFLLAAIYTTLEEKNEK